MGSNAAFAVSITGIPAIEEIGFEGIIQDVTGHFDKAVADINYSQKQALPAVRTNPTAEGRATGRFYWENQIESVQSARNANVFKIMVRESVFVYPSGKISEGMMNWFEKFPKGF